MLFWVEPLPRSLTKGREWCLLIASIVALPLMILLLLTRIRRSQ